MLETARWSDGILVHRFSDFSPFVSLNVSNSMAFFELFVVPTLILAFYDLLIFLLSGNDGNLRSRE